MTVTITALWDQLYLSDTDLHRLMVSITVLIYFSRSTPPISTEPTSRRRLPEHHNRHPPRIQRRDQHRFCSPAHPPARGPGAGHRRRQHGQDGDGARR